MNNPLDNGDDHNLDSIFNNLIQSLGIDPHQQQISCYARLDNE
ncbi:hypothetical protein PCC9214_04585 [Planktothrix tepida]|uniref:Uncharacterized protein n=2 Tax=Planktothrix TaxID=54304 RepID=A0A1J1LLW3_9CYAN|nr:MULTISPECIES: hypothetical protein [Planktothrix]CAD5924168.1 hypothetical protein NO713_00860 [Planktothrix pseudagardhii]CAD5979963.1 hypothetical protein PCC9214_04585 [Planktothrix tepida]CUR33557.1 hypothetical protein PL9214520096 [Planktothrix tepida PCC 9214]